MRILFFALTISFFAFSVDSYAQEKESKKQPKEAKEKPPKKEKGSNKKQASEPVISDSPEFYPKKIKTLVESLCDLRESEEGKIIGSMKVPAGLELDVYEVWPNRVVVMIGGQKVPILKENTNYKEATLAMMSTKKQEDKEESAEIKTLRKEKLSTHVWFVKELTQDGVYFCTHEKNLTNKDVVPDAFLVGVKNIVPGERPKIRAYPIGLHQYKNTRSQIMHYTEDFETFYTYFSNLKNQTESGVAETPVIGAIGTGSVIDEIQLNRDVIEFFERHNFRSMIKKLSDSDEKKAAAYFNSKKTDLEKMSKEAAELYTKLVTLPNKNKSPRSELKKLIPLYTLDSGQFRVKLANILQEYEVWKATTNTSL